MSVNFPPPLPVSTNEEISAPPKLEDGWRTTEFWATIAMCLISVLVALGWIGPDFAKRHEDLVNAVALLAATIAPGIYAISRSIAKRGHQQAVATVLAAKLHTDTVSAALTPPVAYSQPLTGEGTFSTGGG